ncbi:hypothetical protein DLAC_08681 [Tieghemostelium lacteum]|uniref:Protein Lines N-terminal domain-containing protein n=1 Tax=Tieghemostelium lacteum TaxID=361077 RepID=A0A151Z800_TIELA|nr:hypothetical protein DLAC_08681 [Tieghemostelium lacteum]|eukprot:KYQ90096.1 hypothetical protein DLAC_08681 [Tieghemostelium lacteum]
MNVRELVYDIKNVSDKIKQFESTNNLILMFKSLEITEHYQLLLEIKSIDSFEFYYKLLKFINFEKKSVIVDYIVCKCLFNNYDSIESNDIEYYYCISTIYKLLQYTSDLLNSSSRKENNTIENTILSKIIERICQFSSDIYLNHQFRNNVLSSDTMDISYNILKKILKIYILVVNILISVNNDDLSTQFLDHLMSFKSTVTSIDYFTLVDSIHIPSLLLHSKSGNSIILSLLFKLVLESSYLQILQFSDYTLYNELQIKVSQQDYIEDLFNLYLDQDDLLIESMLTLLLIYKLQSPKQQQQVSSTILFNPHSLFRYFIENVCYYDHLMLLEFLISNETSFLEYLLQYLNLIIEEEYPIYNGDVNMQLYSCLQKLELTIQKSSDNNNFPYNPSLLLKRMGKILDIKSNKI